MRSVLLLSWLAIDRFAAAFRPPRPATRTLLFQAATTTTTTTPRQMTNDNNNNNNAAQPQQQPSPLLQRHSSVLFFPPENYASDVRYRQVATGLQITGLQRLEETVASWEFFHDNDHNDVVECTVARVSTTAPTTLLVQWNVTWVAVSWLPHIAQLCQWTPRYVSYLDQADRVRTFSYTALVRLFREAVQTRELRIPLACIQGTTVCEFDKPVTTLPTTATTNKEETINNYCQDPCPKIISIREDLGLALDLAQGRLKNRQCAQDLQFFLEVARRPLPIQQQQQQQQLVSSNNQTADSLSSWEDVVATSLPWSSVPGLRSPLDVDPTAAGDEWVPLAFVGVAIVSLLVFASIVAPTLLGQSLWGNTPPNYFVPSELHSLF